MAYAATKCNPYSHYQAEAILKGIVAVHSIHCAIKGIYSVMSRSSGFGVYTALSGTDRADAKLCVSGANNPQHQTMPAYH